mmetsp:Transcript_46876/g.114182  ORF Transcript_46876/g.114182 Transcript_46876/m.114182 type:complete len:174 (-) Transcript_46876:364-885(-)
MEALQRLAGTGEAGAGRGSEHPAASQERGSGKDEPSMGKDEPSMASMERKLREWELKKREAAVQQQQQQQQQQATQRKVQLASAAPATPAPAPESPQERQAVAALKKQVRTPAQLYKQEFLTEASAANPSAGRLGCVELSQAYRGHHVMLEAACTKNPACKYDFGKQDCGVRK